ncbi:GNAT family N-acetyltransferase [Marmoricola sp. RAF53]|uniref:GNAT family N-acetyltransferase n=1 Tax=Marmoricola sp. RAF53 TaxID=3233059 RepID=UPI003F96AFD9
MSWQELTGTGPVQVRASAVESDRFGVSVDRVLAPLDTPDGPAGVLAAVAASAADVVVLRYPTAWVGLAASLTGRDLVPADQLTYWRLRTGSGRRPAPDPALAVVPASEEDAAARDALVDDLVADIFTGYGNHYSANPLFDPALALAGYQQWARGSAAAGGALVLRDSGGPVAVATTSTVDDVVEIELAGTLTARQGSGLYPHLLAGVEDLALAAGAIEVLISTQTHNTGVQRAWARYGFEPVATFSTLHLLKPGLIERA